MYSVLLARIVQWQWSRRSWWVVANQQNIPLCSPFFCGKKWNISMVLLIQLCSHMVRCLEDVRMDAVPSQSFIAFYCQRNMLMWQEFIALSTHVSLCVAVLWPFPFVFPHWLCCCCLWLPDAQTTVHTHTPTNTPTIFWGCMCGECVCVCVWPTRLSTVTVSLPS